MALTDSIFPITHVAQYDGSNAQELINLMPSAYVTSSSVTLQSESSGVAVISQDSGGYEERTLTTGDWFVYGGQGIMGVYTDVEVNSGFYAKLSDL